MVDIDNIIKTYRGNEPWEPDSVRKDYKKFKDYTYDVKMSLKDINYLLDLLNDYGRETNGAYCAKARFWKILLDSGVNIEVKEDRMFARPPFGCVKNEDKNTCLGCETCKFNCIEEMK